MALDNLLIDLFFVMCFGTVLFVLLNLLFPAIIENVIYQWGAIKKFFSSTRTLLLKEIKTGNENIINSLNINLKREFDGIRTTIKNLKVGQTNYTQTAKKRPEPTTPKKNSFSVVFEKEYDDVFTARLTGEAKQQVKNTLSQLRALGFEIATNVFDDSLDVIEFTAKLNSIPTTC